MRVTVDFLHQVMPVAPRARLTRFAPYIEATATAYSINSEARFCAWIANLAEESSELRYMEEIASGSAYEGRRDLGNTQPGDGRRFKGHGAIQITGRSNTHLYTEYLRQSGHLPFVDFVANPERLAELPYAIDSAGWFWAVFKKLNAKADAKEFLACCIGVNGRNQNTGLPNGWVVRKGYYERALRQFPDGEMISIGDGSAATVVNNEPHPEYATFAEAYPDYVGNTPPDASGVVEAESNPENASQGPQTPGNDTSQATNTTTEATTLSKEKPSAFIRWMTAIKMAIGTIIASVTGYCGSSGIQDQLATKAVDAADPSMFPKIAVWLVFIVIGVAAGVLLIWIASIFYDKAASRANDLNIQKVNQQGVVELTDKTKPPATIDASTVQVQAATAEVKIDALTS